MENVKGFLISKGLLQGDPSAASRPIRQLHTERVSSLYPSVFFFTLLILAVAAEC